MPGIKSYQIQHSKAGIDLGNGFNNGLVRYKDSRGVFREGIRHNETDDLVKDLRSGQVMMFIKLNTGKRGGSFKPMPKHYRNSAKSVFYKEAERKIELPKWR